MAASSLGTVLIQRIDAALGNAASSQTSIARSTTDAVRQPAQTDKGQGTANQVQRDQRENVDRTALQVQSGKGKGVDRTGTQILTRGNLPGNLVTTSVNTTLGSAAKIILQLFANHNFGSTPLQGRQPLINQAPNNASRSANNATNTGTTQTNLSASSSSNNTNLTAAQLARAQSLINTITNSNNNIGTRLTQAINAAYRNDGTPSNQLSAQIARALSQNISQSGLFYESHIKAYTNGQFKLADLRQEPQAQARSTHSTANHQQTTQTGTSSSQTNALQTANQNPSTNTTIQSSTTTQTNLAANTASNVTAANTVYTPGVDPNTHSIVRQQLEVLADQSIQWRGEAWPGTEMQWRVQRHNEENDQQNSPESDEQAQWQTSLKLRLPTLGNIHANIGINGNKIFLNIHTEEEQLNTLQSNSEQLIQQLADRQLQLMQLKLNTFKDLSEDIALETTTNEQDQE